MTSQLKNRIMRRVYAVWFVRKIVPRLAMVSLFGFVAYRVTADSFFVAKVVSNFLAVASSSIWSIPRFIASALNSAEPAALVMISITGMISFYLVIQLLRSIRTLMKNPSYFSSNVGYSRLNSE